MNPFLRFAILLPGAIVETRDEYLGEREEDDVTKLSRHNQKELSVKMAGRVYSLFANCVDADEDELETDPEEVVITVEPTS